MEISTSEEPPCKKCLKYSMCNARLRKELSDYRNPSGVHTISVVSINFLVLMCNDFETYIDEILDSMYPKGVPPANHLDATIHAITTKIFNLQGVEGYSNDLK